MLSTLQPAATGVLLKRSWGANRALTLLGVSMLLLLVATVPLIVLDAREITGVGAWIKPTKFAISGAIYAFTFVWMLSLIRGHRRLVSFVGLVSAGTFMLEIVLIVAQVVRGTTSHFNYTSAFNAAVFSAMGVAITVFWAMTFIAALLLARQEMPERALATGIRAGLFLSLIGMAVAFLMVVPTAEQQAAADSGAPAIIGAHSVGVADGGPGLPLVDWSTRGGDLRVPHFFGLHALQALPLVGWLVQRRSRRLGERRSVALVRLAALAYLALIGLFTWQALRGQSVVAPDALTLAALGGIGLATAAGVAGAMKLLPAR